MSESIILQVKHSHEGVVDYNGKIYRAGEIFRATDSERWLIKAGVCEIPKPLELPAEPEPEPEAEAATSAAAPVTDSTAVSDLTVTELKDELSLRQIEYPKKATKPELVTILEAAVLAETEAQ